MMDKEVMAAKEMLSRIASDFYRLSDMSKNRHGEPVFDEEVMEAIRELGYTIQILDDMLEVAEYHNTANRIIDYGAYE